MTAEAEAQSALLFLRRHRENLCPTAMLGLHITSAVHLSYSIRPAGPIPGVLSWSARTVHSYPLPTSAACLHQMFKALGDRKAHQQRRKEFGLNTIT